MPGNDPREELYRRAPPEYEQWPSWMRQAWTDLARAAARGDASAAYHADVLASLTPTEIQEVSRDGHIGLARRTCDD